MFFILVLLLSFGHTTNFKVQIMRQILFFKYFLNYHKRRFSQNKVVPEYHKQRCCIRKYHELDELKGCKGQL
jgi:hypothetical protein